MKKKIAKNIAVVSAVFIAAFSLMLITNYFQVRGVHPLQTDVMETLREINDAHADNERLQEQIRQLDLLARRAYFIRVDHLMTGVYILLGMLCVFLAAVHVYYVDAEPVPGKPTFPTDEWTEKTAARRYLHFGAIGLAVAALIFAFLSSPHLRTEKREGKPDEMAQVAPSSDSAVAAQEYEPPPAEKPAERLEEVEPTLPAAVVDSGRRSSDRADTTVVVPTEDVVPKATHNAFRGNHSNGISAARNIPVTWNLQSGENIAWRSEIPRHGYNSPVINGNRVFLTGADEQARELYCYDLRTGERLWTLAAGGISGSPAQIPKTTADTGLAASTVATNGKQVCAIFATGDLICADMEGRQLWAKNLGVPDNHYGYASSLIVFGRSLIVQYDNRNSPRILSLDLTTGDERWLRTRTEKITWSSPLIAYIDRRPQLVLMGNPAITAYNPETGEPFWRVEGLNGEVAASPCSAGGIIFGASEYAALIAVDATRGEILWQANDFLPEVSSPVATSEHVYLVTSYGVLACYDAKTGKLVQSFELNAEFYSSPMIVEGKLYVFANDGKVFIYTANSAFTQVGAFETGEKTFATPAFTDGRIVVRTDKSLYCVSHKES